MKKTIPFKSKGTPKKQVKISPLVWILMERKGIEVHWQPNLSAKDARTILLEALEQVRDHITDLDIKDLMKAEKKSKIILH